jgi:hypothetical protein
MRMPTEEPMTDESKWKEIELPITAESLEADLSLMRNNGFWPSSVETGPMVYEVLVNWVIYSHHFEARSPWEEDRRESKENNMRVELMKGLTDMTFNGMPVKLFYDVPDGRFWPTREVNRTAMRPFEGTEAHSDQTSA